jgi:tetratricopeptide (TPR) repeat protein
MGNKSSTSSNDNKEEEKIRIYKEKMIEEKFKKGQELMKEKKYKESLDVFEKYIKLSSDKNNIVISFGNIGQCYFYLREYNNSIKNYENCLEMAIKIKNYNEVFFSYIDFGYYYFFKRL